LPVPHRQHHINYDQLRIRIGGFSTTLQHASCILDRAAVDRLCALFYAMAAKDSH